MRSARFSGKVPVSYNEARTGTHRSGARSIDMRRFLAMAWIAPAAERMNPPYLADERARLDSWLDFQRATLMYKCVGLTGEQLAERPVASSQLSLLGLVRHMAANERIWFRIRFAGADVDDLYQSPEYPRGGRVRSGRPRNR